MIIKSLRPDAYKRETIEVFVVDLLIRDGVVPIVSCTDADFYSNKIYQIVQGLEDESDKDCSSVCIFGCSPEGHSVYLELDGYTPWVRIEIPESWQDNDIEIWRKKAVEKFGEFTIKKEILKRFYGFISNVKGETKQFKYLQCLFPTIRKAQQAMWSIQNSKYEFLKNIEITDKSTKWKTKCLNDLNITPSSWILLDLKQCETNIFCSSTLERKSTCQYEIFSSIENIQPCTRENIPPLILASFDGEMFSYDGSFPNPLKGDKTIFLGLSVTKYGDDKITRYMIGEGDIDLQKSNNDDIIYFPCKSSKEIIEVFRDIIVKLDVDLITGWNTYGFDYVFLEEEYNSYFLPNHLRGSQQSTKQMEKNCIQKYSVHELYSDLYKNKDLFDKWFKQSERTFGVRKMFLLQKECKNLIKQNNTTKSLFDEEEEEEISFLSLDFMSKIRPSLLSALKGDQEAHRILTEEMPDIPCSQPSIELLKENINNGDLNYFTRNVELRGRGHMTSRFAYVDKVQMYEKKMNSMAKGENIYCYWDMHGRINVDLMQVIKDDLQPDDNSLKSAAKTYLQNNELEKIDLSPKEMFDMFKKGNKKDLYTIAEYCARDCDIPLHIIKKLHYIPTWVELSRVSITSVHDIINSGQQTRIINLISRFVYGEYSLNIKKSGWPSTFFNNEWEESEYQGATVIEPIAGFYPENCVITMDFESLYPSVMRFYNLCPSTLVIEGTQTIHPKNKEVHSISHTTYTKEYTFVNHVEGVIPKLLKHLITARKGVKKIMAQEKDPFQYALLNGRQNGLKRVCNSVYGFFGVSENTGVLPCKPIAAVTTLKGRAFIGATKDYVEKNYAGCTVIYGDTDSVMIKCPETMNLEQANEFGEKLSKEITEKLQNGKIEGLGGAGELAREHEKENGRRIKDACSAMNLAFEKVYMPYLLLKKKRYAGIKYAGGKSTMEMKGIDCIRRDRPKLLRQISLQILESLLKTQDIEKAKEQLKIYLDSIVKEKLPFEDFILSKSVNATYVSENLPHLGALKRMMARGEETPPVGARMHFIVCKGDSSGIPLYDRTEHPSYAKNANKEIDFLYYLDSLYTPLHGLLQYVTNINEIKEIFKINKDYINNKSQTSLFSLLGKRNDLELHETQHESQFNQIIKKPKLVKQPIQTKLNLEKQQTLKKFFG